MDNIPLVALPMADTDDTDVDAAVTWIAERYTMSDASARILLDHLARQDDVSTPGAARSLLAPTGGETLTPSKPIPRGHHLR